MKLAFNVLNSGLGNNGGTRTIILSAQTLERLGHSCDIVGTVDKFTWFEHKPIISYFPKDLDAVINVAAVDYMITKKLDVPIKLCWWRGHESWRNKEEYLRYCYTDKEIKNLVNSKGLQNFLSIYGAASEVLYQGIDFDLWEDRQLRDNNKIRIGCLYNSKPTKRWNDFIELSNILGTDDYEYIGIGDTHRDDKFLTYFKANATVEELNNIYSSCHIWFAPTEQEGLHNIPMEANLCGCLVVCSDHPLNGMTYDYAGTACAMRYPIGDIKKAAELVRRPEWRKVYNMQLILESFIGTRETNMKRLVDIINNYRKK